MTIPNKEFLEKFMNTVGAMSVAEGLALYNVCLDAPNGNWIELGTHKGKSSIMIVLSVAPETDLNLVEPEFENEEWREDVFNLINELLPENGLLLHSNYSFNVLPLFKNISFCFVDSGNHQDGLPMQEALLLEDKMVQGGIIAWHDFGNQFREPKEAAQYLVNTGKYEWIPIDWKPINDYCNEHDLESKNDSWHKYDHDGIKNPNFLGAIRRK